MRRLKIRVLILVILFSLASALDGVCEEANSNLIKELKLIEEKMSNITTLSTQFIEEKNLALFDQKLLIKGSLYLQKPSSFAWHISSPLKQRIILRGNVVVQWDEDTNQVQKIDLTSNPSFNVITDQMKRWVSGSYLSLVDEYKIEIMQSSPIKLKFTPFENTVVFKVIKSIMILFQKDEKYIDTIDILETSGDSTKFQFLETSLNLKLDSQVWKVKTSD